MEGSWINGMALCLLDVGGVKSAENEWGKIARATDIRAGIIHDTWAPKLQPLST